MNLLFDGHIHTKLCNHASGEMEEYVQAAIAIGLTEMVFLEHMEEGIRSPLKTWLSEQDFDIYFSEGKRLQEKYHNRIAIKMGVEVGYNPEYKDTLLERLAKRTWDVIGLSYHFFSPSHDQPHINLLSRDPEHHKRAREYGVDHIFKTYLKDLTEAVVTIPATTLCHLDAALRHLPEADITTSFLPEITTLLKVVKNQQLLLEINTSGIDFRKEIFPTQAIRDIAKDLGIPFCLGSDAHKPSDVGRYFTTLHSIV